MTPCLVPLGHPLARREHLMADLDGKGAARCKEAALRAVPGSRRRPGDADELVLARHLGDRLDEPARIRMCRGAEEIALRTDLDDAPGVHHGDAVGER